MFFILFPVDIFFLSFTQIVFFCLMSLKGRANLHSCIILQTQIVELSCMYWTVRKALYCCSVYYIFITLKKRYTTMSKRHHCELTHLSWGNNILAMTADDTNGLSMWHLVAPLLWVSFFGSVEENANLNLINPAPNDSKKSIPMANWEQMSFSSLGDDGKGMFCFWKWIFYYSYNFTNNNHLWKLGQQRQSAEKLHFVIIVTVVLTDAAALLCLVIEMSTLSYVDQTVNQYCSLL